MTSLTILLPLQKQTTTTIYKILIKLDGFTSLGTPKTSFSDILNGRINLKKEKLPSAGII